MGALLRGSVRPHPTFSISRRRRNSKPSSLSAEWSLAQPAMVNLRLARGRAGSSPQRSTDMAQKWEYRVVYVDPRGRISCEGVEFVRQSAENRTAFVKRYLDTLGEDGWEVTA